MILRVGGLLLPWLHGWVYLLAGLFVQAGLQAELYGWEELLSVFQGQLGPLPGLCNHIWFGGASSCAPQITRWCHWLDSTFKWGHKPDFTVGWSLRLCSEIKWMNSSCAIKLNGAIGLVLQSGRLLLSWLSGQLGSQAVLLWSGEVTSCASLLPRPNGWDACLGEATSFVQK